MKRLAAAIILFSNSFLWADTYLYRIDASYGKTAIKAFAAAFETKNDQQPYVNTFVLTQPDTNYFLLKTTPNDGINKTLEQSIPGCSLYQIQRINSEGSFENVVDNSKSFPIDKNWAVETSSK